MHYNIQMHIQEVKETEYDNYGKLKSERQVKDRLNCSLTANELMDLIDKAKAILDIEQNL